LYQQKEGNNCQDLSDSKSTDEQREISEKESNSPIARALVGMKGTGPKVKERKT
jgi:hypothetical protein